MADLGAIFELTVSPIELIVRGTVMYWFLFVLLRFVLRRDVGSIGMADVLLIVLIADAAQNGMSGSYESVTEACILVGTIAAWNWLLDMVAYRVPAVRRVLEAKPLPLVRNGRLMHHSLRRELISRDEMMSVLRQHGLERLDQVKLATMEGDGEISVIKREEGQPAPADAPKRKVPV
jgi:uncharacterized membrane protein YcaP (DUF421 family)